MNKIEEWGNKPFMRVSKVRYENFCRYFKGKIEHNFFMDWNDSYDWSLNPGFDIDNATEEESWLNLDKCMVARHYCGYKDEYYISVDYIKANNYDLDTIVPKPKKKRLTKKEKILSEAMCEAFDDLWRKIVNEEAKRRNDL